MNTFCQGKYHHCLTFHLLYYRICASDVQSSGWSQSVSAITLLLTFRSVLLKMSFLLSDQRSGAEDRVS